MEKETTQCVDQQLAAYNSHDIEAFVAAYREDIKLYEFPSVLICEGRARLRDMYAGFFQRAPRIHAQLINRIVLKNRVIDHELVTSRAGKSDMRAVAIYEVSGGLITKVWFLK